MSSRTTRNGIACWLTISLRVKRMVTFGLRDSRVYPVGATANEKRRIRQQAAMFVLKERLLYYRATDAVNEMCLKGVIANAKERTKIIRACHDGVDGCHYGRDKTRAKVHYLKRAPLKDKTPVGVADFLFTVFYRHGWPDIIISDQGREFVNQLSSCLFKLTGNEHRISSPYQKLICAALYAYRIAKQDSSPFSPFFIMYNRDPRMAIDHEFSCKATTNVTAIREKYHQKVLKNIERAQQRQKAQYSAKCGTLHSFRPSGITFKWLRHSPRVASSGMGEEESIYLI
ncbi:hypothetical protein EMCRGX_G029041 [Ephydatia muelleri]